MKLGKLVTLATKAVALSPPLDPFTGTRLVGKPLEQWKQARKSFTDKKTGLPPNIDMKVWAARLYSAAHPKQPGFVATFVTNVVRGVVGGATGGASELVIQAAQKRG